MMNPLGRDPITNRVQFEMGVRFDLMPPGSIGWKKWAFDPFFGLTLPGQVLTNPRSQLPKIEHWAEDASTGEKDPITGLKVWRWISRAFWLRAGVRVLRLDIRFRLAL